jgi:hypothetical protein
VSGRILTREQHLRTRRVTISKCHRTYRPIAAFHIKYGADLIVTLKFQFPDVEFLLGFAHTLEFEI